MASVTALTSRTRPSATPYHPDFSPTSSVFALRPSRSGVMCPRRCVRRRMGVAMAEPPGMTESEPGVSFGARLQRAREAAGLSQEDLAARAALSPNAVGALERGERRHPNPATVRALAVALAMTDAERAALVASVPRRGQTPADEPTSVR